MPTNSDPSGAAQTLVSAAKGAIVAGDRARALRVLDGLRYRRADEGPQLATAIAEALVATAAGEHVQEGELLVRQLEDAHAALRQILDWIDALPFDVDELAQIAATASRRHNVTVRTDRATHESIQPDESGKRAVPFGAGWLEWRWIAKPSGRQFGPYVYYRWREGGRKRTRYVGKVGVPIDG